MLKQLNIPNTSRGVSPISINKNLIIVGANGAGKSRFGVVVEQHNNPSKRISAQRYLQLSDAVQKQDYTSAETNLRNAFKNQPVVNPQNDYSQLMISLFAQEAKRDSDFIIKYKNSTEKLPVPKSVKDSVVEIWNFIFPYRIIKLENDRIRAVADGADFSGTEMSDGEKVGLYLISQVCLADKNCVLIIDEPELHLHKALMVRLWNKLEQERADCTFVYITHDLDFAASKSTEKMIWIRSYKSGTWDWVEVDANGVISENLYLEVLGSRKPILFVEGEKGSLDSQIYQAFYEGYTVIPCGSCTKVIEAVKGLKAHAGLHQNQVFGVIDKDFRSQVELSSLESDGIKTIALNEVENLFLAPKLLDLVCKHLNKDNKKSEITDAVNQLFNESKEQLKFSVSKSRMYRHLNEKFGQVSDSSSYELFKSSISSDLDSIKNADSIPSGELTLEQILKVYPNKGLVGRIQGHLELTKSGYKNLVLGFLASDKRAAVLECIKEYMPSLD